MRNGRPVAETVTFNHAIANVRPEVLNALVTILGSALPVPTRRRTSEVVRSIGIAGFVAALAIDGQAREQLGEAVKRALDAIASNAELYRRTGSQFCAAALGMRPPT